MRALLDTHTLLWWLTADPRLSPLVQSLITDTASEISSAPPAEISTKHRIGKLLAARSELLSMPLLTSDEALKGFPCRVVW